MQGLTSPTERIGTNQKIKATASDTGQLPCVVAGKN